MVRLAPAPFFPPFGREKTARPLPSLSLRRALSLFPFVIPFRYEQKKSPLKRKEWAFLLSKFFKIFLKIKPKSL
jgi:hypothetical protein